MTEHESRENAENKFRSFLQKLVRVPRREIDEKEREYQEQRQREKVEIKDD